VDEDEAEDEGTMARTKGRWRRDDGEGSMAKGRWRSDDGEVTWFEHLNHWGRMARTKG